MFMTDPSGNPALVQACFVNPHLNVSQSDMLVRLLVTFNSLDLVQNNTFYEVTETSIASGEEFYVPANEMFFLHYTSENNEDGGLAVLELSEDCSSIELQFTSDDWQLPWMSPTYQPFIVLSAYQTGVGWYLMGFVGTTTTCQIRFTSVQATTLSADSITEHVSLTKASTIESIGLVHVKLPTTAVAVQVNFQTTVDNVVAQSSQIPPVGFWQSTYFLPDYVSYLKSYKHFAYSLM
jgi:hypothetical protein